MDFAYTMKALRSKKKVGDLKLLTSYLEEADLITTNHSTKRSSRSFRISRDHSTLRSSRGHHHFTSPLDHETTTRPLTRPPGSSIVLNPSKYFVVLSIRVSGYLAISSMYFSFS
ncbi:unnamed protein product [Arabidopsis thaliana]|uniref:Uncharacterized protein n=1 Tax=Arabidopsis thaliana TaxID=3702 RepID=A0A654EAK0_ARATH|nr:unnamed protein product [Arabidopsis thaliana]